MSAKDSMGVYTDPRSQRQIAAFKRHELLGARERNEINARRWTDHLRIEWELAQIGEARTVKL